ncbi:MAG: T9SS type A sorting domain-containing protein [Flavobacteriaceae bacterium]
MMKYLLFLLFGNFVFAQTVSTYFSDPTAKITDAVVFDADGNLYGSDFNGNSVYKVTPGGVTTTFVSGLANPNGLAFDSSGNLFVVEYSGASIHKYDSSGTLLESFNVGSFPSGLIKSFDTDDMIFTLTSNSSVNILTASGAVIELYQGAPLNTPVGLAYDDLGNLYAGNYTGREIYKVFNGGTEYVATVPDGGSNSSLAFITYGNGNLWGTVFFTGHKIFSINPEGVDDVTLFAGSEQGNADGDISVATFDSPSGLVYNNDENALYISEFTSDGNVRKIENILSVGDFSSEINLKLFPNPVQDYLSVSGFIQNNNGEARVTIYDTTGRIIKTFDKTLDENNININISEIESGLYYLELNLENKKSIIKSFIKK